MFLIFLVLNEDLKVSSIRRVRLITLFSSNFSQIYTGTIYYVMHIVASVTIWYFVKFKVVLTFVSL